MALVDWDVAEKASAEEEDVVDVDTGHDREAVVDGRRHGVVLPCKRWVLGGWFEGEMLDDELRMCQAKMQEVAH